MADIKTDTFIDYIKTRHLSRDTLIEDFVAAALMLIDTGTFPKVQTWDDQGSGGVKNKILARISKTVGRASP